MTELTLSGLHIPNTHARTHLRVESGVMDLLLKAYSTASDDEDELVRPSSKRPKPNNPIPFTKPEHHPYPPSGLYPMPRPNQSSDLHTEAPVAGRYISKRERALLNSATGTPDPVPNPPPTTSSPGTLSLSHSLSHSTFRGI
jgi:hypothetical protein